MAESAALSFLCFLVLHTRRRDSTTITIAAIPAPAPIPASAPMERLGAAGCTGNWIAKTIFMIADVGFWPGFDDGSKVLEVMFPPAVIGTDSGIWEVAGTGGGTR